jgi:hypothetical protein
MIEKCPICGSPLTTPLDPTEGDWSICRDSCDGNQSWYGKCHYRVSDDYRQIIFLGGKFQAEISNNNSLVSINCGDGWHTSLIGKPNDIDWVIEILRSYQQSILFIRLTIALYVMQS